MHINNANTFDSPTLLEKVSNKQLFDTICAYTLSKVLFILLFIMFFIPAHAAPIITNTVHANFSINGVTQQLSDSIQFTKETEVAPTDTLNISKSANVNEAIIGDLIEYTVMVENPNPRILENVSIQDSLPIGLIYQQSSATLNAVNLSNSAVDYSGNTLTFTLGDIPANSQYFIRYQTHISNTTPMGVASNRAIAISNTATSAQTRANIVINPVVIEEPTVPLNLTKVADKASAKVGDTIRYTLSMTNDNTHAISNALVRDLLPIGLNYVEGSALFNNQSISATQNTGLNFHIVEVPANSTSVLRYDAVVIEESNLARTLINSANVIADETEANSNTASATINVIDDELSLTKTTTNTVVRTGDIVDYTIIFTNSLARDLSNFKIEDTLPAGFVFKPGSATVNSTAFSEANIRITGQLVEFLIGNVVPSTTIVLNYQATVTESAVPGDNINQAHASSDYASSAIATASVKVRTPSTINFYKIDNAGVSSIIQPTSFNTNQEGGKNFEEIETIPLPDGSSITLPTPQPIIAANQYTIGEPVIIEVIDLDQNTDPNALDTIEVIVSIPGTNDTENLLLQETAPNSGIFRGIVQTTTAATQVQDGNITITDGVNINVRYNDEDDSTDVSATAALVVPNTQLQIDKTADKSDATVGELVRYTLEFRNTTGFELPTVTVHDLLPPGFMYVNASAKLNNQAFNNVTFDGNNLGFSLINMPADSIWTLEYITKISAGAEIGQAINTAYLESGLLRSNDAQAIVDIKDDLMRTKNILTGRVYIGCKTKSDKGEKAPKVLSEARIFMETGRSVLTDIEGFWHMEGVHSGAHVVQLDTDSIPGYEPIICHENSRKARNAKSHFVDLQAGSLWHVDFHVQAIEGYISQTKEKSVSDIEKDPKKIFTKEYIEDATDKFEILWPKNNYVPDVASTKIFIKSSPQHKVDVFLNGKKVNALNYDGSDTNTKRTVIVRRWLGVDIDIKKRNNTLLAILKSKTGKELARKTHNIHFSGNPASAEFIEEKSILVADGKTSPVIALRIKDEDGFPMRANTHGYFTLKNNKYSVKTHNTNSTKATGLNESLSGSYKYLIGREGIARIELNPTTQSGEVKLNLQFLDNKQSKNHDISAWLKPALRDWILVGLAEGTLTQEIIKGNMEPLSVVDKEADFSKRGRVAFFAKGQIKGKYLLTIAYDTHKQNRKMGSQLNGNIDPDAYYTVYADNSNSQYDAPSSEKLYLKLERNNFYALFGDFQTNLTITELANYQRTLNGIKTEYQDERLSYNAFISETSNNHQQEEIPGDGTSGLYQLAEQIVPNSETIAIETRDRYNSDRVLVRKELRRYQDYNIDYSEGTLFFKFPIAGRDRNFNPNIIIVDYDSESESNKSITAGGRIALSSKNKKLETGLSFIHKGRSNMSDDQLLAADINYKVTDDTALKVEIAQSKTQSSEFEKRNAYILELTKQIAGLEATLYAKLQDSHFGIQSQGSETGTKKIGAEVDYRVNKKTRIKSEVALQSNLDNDNKRRHAKIEVTRAYKRFDFNVGYRHTEETLQANSIDYQSIKSDTMLLGAQYTTKNNKLTLRTDIEKNISDATGSEASPDRLAFSADYKLQQGFSLFAENETTDNGNQKTNNTRIGISKELWKGAKARTTYTQERTDQAQRNYATLGLSQTLKINENIQVDLSIDQAKTLVDNQPRFNENEPERFGTQRDDYTAFSVGLGSNDDDWSWTTRAEYRNGDLYDKVNFLASAIRHYNNGKSLSAKLSFFNKDNLDSSQEKETKLSFGSAWHPKERDTVFFSRLDLISSQSNTVNSDTNNNNHNDTQKVIHNMHYHRKINKKTRVGFHHGIKYVTDSNNGAKTSATIDTGTFEIRRDINKRWDLGLRGGYLKDWDTDAVDYVAGISLGVNPKKNIWIELGYNIEGFQDDDFDNRNHTSEGIYLDFRYKFDQDTWNGFKKKH